MGCLHVELVSLLFVVLHYTVRDSKFCSFAFQGVFFATFNEGNHLVKAIKASSSLLINLNASRTETLFAFLLNFPLLSHKNVPLLQKQCKSNVLTIL